MVKIRCLLLALSLVLVTAPAGAGQTVDEGAEASAPGPLDQNASADVVAQDGSATVTLATEGELANATEALTLPGDALAAVDDAVGTVWNVVWNDVVWNDVVWNVVGTAFDEVLELCEFVVGLLGPYQCQ
jgi:hypothetical protein